MCAGKVYYGMVEDDNYEEDRNSIIECDAAVWVRHYGIPGKYNSTC